MNVNCAEYGMPYVSEPISTNSLLMSCHSMERYQKQIVMVVPCWLDPSARFFLSNLDVFKIQNGIYMLFVLTIHTFSACFMLTANFACDKTCPAPKGFQSTSVFRIFLGTALQCSIISALELRKRFNPNRFPLTIPILTQWLLVSDCPPS